MPPFRTVTAIGNIKPARRCWRKSSTNAGEEHPALVAQRFGRGRSAALLIGDFWRWSLRGEAGKESDLEKSWRQTVRWLVADVPQRVDVSVRAQDESQVGGVVVEVRVRDAEYLPLDNAQVSIEVDNARRQEARARGRSLRRRTGRIRGDATFRGNPVRTVPR